jgi:hypothetical protein
MSVEFVQVKISCVLQGALMDVTATGSPEEVLCRLKEIDPDVKFRDSFPSFGKGGGGKATKDAKVITVSIKTNNGNKFVDLGCSCDDGDQSIAVSKKKVDDFVSGMKDRLPGQAGDFDKPSALVMIRDEEKLVPIKYFEIDGKFYFDSFGV